VTLHALCPRVPLYTGGRRSLRQAAVFALSCLRLLRRQFDVLEADHIPYLQVFTLRLVASAKRTPFVVTWHEVWGPDSWRRYLGPAGRVAWWIERTAMRLPDEIIAASPQTARRLRAVLGEDAVVTVAPNGIDLAAVRATEAAAPASDLVVVGRLLDHKRIDLLLETVALLHARGRRVTCRVIGEGPEREALTRRSWAVGIAGAVEFRHDVDGQEELYALVKAARAFVFPSAREGFGIAVLEALACGLPVVTTSEPDNLSQDLVRRSARGVVCEPSAPALADAVAGVLDAVEREGRPADEPWLAEYDWDVVGDTVMARVLP
jgi:glycosyltransferase involved in cell wall biosynthesis